MQEFPLPLLTPIGAILAACITGAVSFISLVISKEQKVSDFRQSWIDALRKELADFAGNARRISIDEVPNFDALMATTVRDHAEALNKAALRQDPLREHRLNMAQNYYAIRLRMNPSEADHQALLVKIDLVYNLLNSHESTEVIDALDEMFLVAQPLLKREWTRVKSGERIFRITTQFAKWVAIISTISIASMTSYILWHTRIS